MTRLPTAIALLLLAGSSMAQVNVPGNGPRRAAHPVHAFTHATVHVAPGEVLDNATLLVQDDRIIAVGAKVKVPKGAVVRDLSGLHLWPALIDAGSTYGMPALDKPREERSTGAHFWNRAVQASARADALFVPDPAKAMPLRAQGIGTVITHRPDGIMQGTSTAVALADRSVNEDILVPRASALFSFRKGTSPDPYPSSLMGSIALLRQTLYDAQWYAGQGHLRQSDTELEALNAQLSLPLVFEASERNDVLRIAAIGREFGLKFVVKGNGDEYARLPEIAATGQTLILPLTLPEAFDVEDPFEALEVSTAQLKHWELAPTNAARLQAAGVPFVFTAQGLKEPAELWASLRRMVLAGLDSTEAIAAFTTRPAALFGLGDRLGALREGMLASFLITSDHLLDKRNIIHETWVAGQRFLLKSHDDEDLRGIFDLNLLTTILKLEVKGEEKPEVEVYRSGADSVRVKANVQRADQLITVQFDGTKLGLAGPVRLNGIVHDRGGIWDGQAVLPGGKWTAWSAVRQAVRREDDGRKKEDLTLDSLYRAPVGEVWFPMSGFGTPQLPDTEIIMFRHATVWTNGPQGILRDADVCISGGRIKAVGQGLDEHGLFPGKDRPIITEVDATGRHLTCGIIDEHSHIAISRGVNEGSQAVTSEVRIGDVVDPDHVSIYRDLAGGVTAVQQLHGSANPIGGQSSLIKLRWGLDADGLRIQDVPGFIKFALGENVKQSNWNTDGRRFPQTRMGVEQVMYDAFHRARAYASERDTYETLKPKDRALAHAPRRDLELDALVEVQQGRRFITCHSYVQSEIAMLMEVADSMGFTVNTFTHILEGYKVAGKLRAHGASASTFSDWWGYKVEVNDAIPYNAALLWKAGVNTGLNSDDGEMSRRLNQEAAKAVKYGGVPAEEAWKMVTLNPACMLRLDHRMGSVEVGKDADIVLWSTDPLSIDAKCLMTFVDGVRRFDMKQDLERRLAQYQERERLNARMIAAKRAGAPVRKGERSEQREWECDTMGERP